MNKIRVDLPNSLPTDYSKKAYSPYDWLLLEDLDYYVEGLGHVTIPKGYMTDFESVPRVPFLFSFAKLVAVKESVLHDYMYDCMTHKVTRKFADQVFYNAMRRSGVSKFRAYPMYLAVRAFGWRPWNKDSRHKCPNFLEKKKKGKIL